MKSDVPSPEGECNLLPGSTATRKGGASGTRAAGQRTPGRTKSRPIDNSSSRETRAGLQGAGGGHASVSVRFQRAQRMARSSSMASNGSARTFASVK